MATIAFENETYQGADVSDAEKSLLLNQLYLNIVGESAVLLRLLRDNENRILAALSVAKDKLKVGFSGMYAGDGELGVRLIRPCDILRSTSATETPVNDWEVTFTAGANGWVGYGSSNGTAINIDRRIGTILLLGLELTSGASPVVEDWYPQLGGTTYPIQVVRHMWMADNQNLARIARIRPLMMYQGQTAYIQVRTRAAGVNQLVPLGLTFARGDYLRLLAPTTVLV